MLLIAVAAVWTAYFTGRNSIKRDMLAIQAMHALAPELYVRNVNEYACLQIDRMDDIREYQCYLPPGHRYKLHLQWTKDFTLSDKVLTPDVSTDLSAGTHRVLLNEQSEALTVSIDGKEVFNVPKKRKRSVTSSTGANHRFGSQWYALDQPLTLIRLRESNSGQIRNDLGPGIALWVELTD